MSRKLLTSFVLCLTSLLMVHGDYSCLCNYEVETPVYPEGSKTGSPIGLMYEFDCKPVYDEPVTITNMQAIQFEKQIGYVSLNSSNVLIQTCAGDIPKDDLVKPAAHSSPSTHVQSTIQTTVTPMVTSSVLSTPTSQEVTVSTVPTTMSSTIQLATSTLSATVPTTVVSTTVPTTIPSTIQVATSTTSTLIPTTVISTTVSTTISSTTPVRTTTKSTTVPITTLPTTIPTSTTVTTTISNTTTITTAAPTMQIPHCPSNWLMFQGSCYHIHSNGRKNWEHANQYCMDHGSHLVIVETTEENTFIIGQMHGKIPTDSSHDANTGVWMGGTDHDSEGTWVWRNTITHSDTPVSDGFTFWRQGEPDSGDGDHDEDCMCFIGNKQFEWQDHRCSESMYFVCEKPVVTETATIQSVPTTTIAPVSMSPYTGPSTQKPNCLAGWLSFQDSCYLIHTDDRWDWDHADAYCRVHHAHLATIQTRDENNFIIEKLRGRVHSTHHDVDSGVWLGGSDRDAEGTWVWRDSIQHLDVSVSSGFTFWKQGEPDSGAGDHDEDCLCMIGNKQFEWQDHRCQESMFFVCERSLYYEPHMALIG